MKAKIKLIFILLVGIFQHSYSQLNWRPNYILVSKIKEVQINRRDSLGFTEESIFISYSTEGLPNSSIKISERDTILTKFSFSALKPEATLKPIYLLVGHNFKNNKILSTEIYGFKYPMYEGDTLFYSLIIENDTIIHKDYIYNDYGALVKVVTKKGGNIVQQKNIEYWMKGAGESFEKHTTLLLSNGEIIDTLEFTILEKDPCSHIKEIKYFAKDSTIQRLDFFSAVSYYKGLDMPKTKIILFTTEIIDAYQNWDKEALVLALHKNLGNSRRRTESYHFKYFEEEKKEAKPKKNRKHGNR